MGRIPLTLMEREDLSLRTSKMFREISERSGLSATELEKIFQIGTAGTPTTKAGPVTYGKYWKKYEKRERCPPTDREQEIKIQALEKGWLSEEWRLDLILTEIRKDEGPSKYAAAKKIERHLGKIVQIMANEMPGMEEDHLYYLHRLGDRLAELYIQEWQRVCPGPGWEDLENSIAEKKQKTKIMLQFCSTENENS